MTLLLAKPYHSLEAHSEDAYRVFREYWKRHEASMRRKAAQLGIPYLEWRFWHAFAVYVHDFGKAQPLWQERLTAGERRLITHSLVSFGLACTLVNRWWNAHIKEGHSIFLSMQAMLAILAHHHMLHRRSFEYVRQERAFRVLTASFNGWLFEFFRREPSPYGDLPLFEEGHLSWRGSELRETIRQLEQPLRKMKTENHIKDLLTYKMAYTSILRTICLCDNAASAAGDRLFGNAEKPVNQPAVTKESLAMLEDKWLFSPAAVFGEGFLKKRPNRIQQKVLGRLSKHMILKAGCGEGKTMAALLFAKHWIDRGDAQRIIFTMPTRFTANSMFDDFRDAGKYNLHAPSVGLYHSEARRVLFDWYARGFDRDDDKRENAEELLVKRVEDEHFLDHFYERPVTVSTVDHLVYSLLHCHKYADRAFGNLQQAVVLFDELHFYDKYTIRKIGQALQLLHAMEVPHLLMTATMPDTLYDSLQHATRHAYTLIESDGMDEGGRRIKEPFVIEKVDEPLIDRAGAVSEIALRIINEHLGTRIMIVTNQVEKAKKLTQMLKNKEPYKSVPIICYHSEYHLLAKQKKERLIKAIFKRPADRTDADRELLEKEGWIDAEAVILVASPICELSLDISADVQLTDLAPIDALSQRGGRLHRNGLAPNRTACQCAICLERAYLPAEFPYVQYVFNLPYKEHGAGLPYVTSKEAEAKPDTHLLARSWELLGTSYTFPNINRWVSELYKDTSFPVEDHEMVRMVMEDAVFGAKPEERFGTNADSDESTGSFQLRASHYATYQVLPSCYLAQVSEQFAEITKASGGSVTGEKGWGRQEITACWEYVKDYLVTLNQWKWHTLRELDRIQIIEDFPVRLRVAHVKYEGKGEGFLFDEDYVEMSMSML